MDKIQLTDRQAEIDRETFFLPPEEAIDLNAEQDAKPEEALYEGDAAIGNGYADNTTAWD